MTNLKKAIICDLDGTLAESKSSISEEMSSLLCGLLKKHYLIVVSGGEFKQFQSQFLSKLFCPVESLKNLYLFPTMGGSCFVFDLEGATWKALYREELSSEERENIINAIKYSMTKSGIDFSSPYGDIIEDRGTQVTFSGRGQLAPLQVKKEWDNDRSKRNKLIELICKKLEGYDVKIGGMTSIDITKQGIDKAFVIKKVKELLNLKKEEMIFIGDALFPEGNDFSVRKTGIECVQKNGPEETLEFLKTYL